MGRVTAPPTKKRHAFFCRTALSAGLPKCRHKFFGPAGEEPKSARRREKRSRAAARTTKVLGARREPRVALNLNMPRPLAGLRRMPGFRPWGDFR